MLRRPQKQETRAGGEVSVGVRLEGSLKPNHRRLDCHPTWGTLRAWRVRPWAGARGGCSPVLADWAMKEGLGGRRILFCSLGNKKKKVERETKSQLSWQQGWGLGESPVRRVE